MFMFQLEDQYTLYEYGININDIIQLVFIRPQNIPPPKDTNDVITSVVTCSSTSNEVQFFL